MVVRFLKTLKTKKLKTKNSQIKQKCLNMSKTCYDIQTWCVQLSDQKKIAEKASKNWNWPFFISHD